MENRALGVSPSQLLQLGCRTWLLVQQLCSTCEGRSLLAADSGMNQRPWCEHTLGLAYNDLLTLCLGKTGSPVIHGILADFPPRLVDLMSCFQELQVAGK